MRHLGQISRRTFALLAIIALALDFLALGGLDIGLGPHSFADRIEAYTFCFFFGYFASLVIVVVAFYLLEILRDLIKWISRKS
jgi:hypothetical protein